jgi:hypothetical protein
LAETIVIYGIGIYGIFGREIIKYTVTYGAYIQFWPTLSIFSPVCVTSPVCEPCSAPLLPGHCQEYILYTPIARALSGVHFVHPYCPGTVRSTFCTPLLPGHCQEYILYTPIARALSGVHFVHRSAVYFTHMQGRVSQNRMPAPCISVCAVISLLTIPHT